MSDYTCQIDTRQVDALLAELTPEKREQIMFKALQQGAQTLVELTKAAMLRKVGAGASRVDNYGQKMTDAVGMSKNKFYNSVAVSILQEYRAKWFELGTQTRYTKKDSKPRPDGKLRKTIKKGEHRGSIRPLYFFKEAQDDSATLEAIKVSIESQFNKLNTN